jgi:hypothetical protein
VGPLTGRKLAWIPTTMTTWGEWKREHPKTTVLGRALPMDAYNETKAGYAIYRSRGKPMFATGPNPTSDAFGAMESITITRIDGKPRAYPHRSLKEGVNSDGDLIITRKGATVVVRDKEGAIVPSMSAFWFAFGAFYPDGTVWAPAPDPVEEPKEPQVPKEPREPEDSR